MSEYQYYEFQAIDRPLDDADRKALRAISSRARITRTSFTNSYEWGDFKGDPNKLMDRWFDLHLYLANWGTHRLMVRLPKRLVDRKRLDGFLRKVECAALRPSGENLILDIEITELEVEDYWDEDGDDDSHWLAALAPLRADVLAGDLRLFYLLWLTAVEADAVGPDEAEPLPGIGPRTGALDTFAQFFDLDADLVEAAAERSAVATAREPARRDAVRRRVAALPDQEKTALLARLAEGDPHVANELRALVRNRLASEAASAPALRTAGALRARALKNSPGAGTQVQRKARRRAEAASGRGNARAAGASRFPRTAGRDGLERDRIRDRTPQSQVIRPSRACSLTSK